MSWSSKIFAIDADSLKGKLILLILDKVLISAIVAAVFVTYDQYRKSDQQNFERELVELTSQLEQERRIQDAVRQERATEIQRKFERTRLARELLPLVLKKDENVIARGYVLRSSLETGLITRDVAVDVLQTLYRQGLPALDVTRIASATMPNGLASIARIGERLKEAWILENHSPSSIYAHKLGLERLSAKSSKIARERLVWRAVLKETLPRLATNGEKNHIEIEFLAKNLSGLFFMMINNDSGSTTRLMQSNSQVMRILGSLDALVHNWGPLVEAGRTINEELGNLDFSKIHHIRYARNIVDILSTYSDYGSQISPYVADALAKLLIDGTFADRIAWIPKDATDADRTKYFATDEAANGHAGLQFRAGELLGNMGKRAAKAQYLLIAYLDSVRGKLNGIGEQEDVQMLRAKLGKYSVRHAIEILAQIDSAQSNAAIERLLQVDENKLRAFGEAMMVLRNLDQFRGK